MNNNVVRIGVTKRTSPHDTKFDRLASSLAEKTGQPLEDVAEALHAALAIVYRERREKAQMPWRKPDDPRKEGGGFISLRD